MQQPQAPATVWPQMDVQPQSSNFSKDLSNEQLAQWLRNHPSLIGTDYEEDISKLRGAYHTVQYSYQWLKFSSQYGCKQLCSHVSRVLLYQLTKIISAINL